MCGINKKVAYGLATSSQVRTSKKCCTLTTVLLQISHREDCPANAQINTNCDQNTILASNEAQEKNIFAEKVCCHHHIFLGEDGEPES